MLGPLMVTQAMLPLIRKGKRKLVMPLHPLPFQNAKHLETHDATRAEVSLRGICLRGTSSGASYAETTHVCEWHVEEADCAPFPAAP